MALGRGRLKLFNPLGFRSPSRMEMAGWLSRSAVFITWFWLGAAEYGPPLCGVSLAGESMRESVGFSLLSVEMVRRLCLWRGPARRGQRTEIPLNVAEFLVNSVSSR